MILEIILGMKKMFLLSLFLVGNVLVASSNSLVSMDLKLMQMHVFS